MHDYLQAVDPDNDIAATMDMLYIILYMEGRVQGRTAIKLVAVVTMLEEEMWDLAAAFMRKHTASADPEQLDSCPFAMNSVISGLISRKASISFLDGCFSFLRGFCTDQGLGHLWGELITCAQHDPPLPSQFLLAVQAGNQELCRSACILVQAWNSESCPLRLQPAVHHSCQHTCICDMA